MSSITLNAADTLPHFWQYFVPSWYQAFCLVLYPALAAAAVSMAAAIVPGRKNRTRKPSVGLLLCCVIPGSLPAVGAARFFSTIFDYFAQISCF